MKPTKPIRIPRTIADMLHPTAQTDLQKAQQRMEALSNMQMQITIRDGTGTPRVGVGRIQISGSSATMQITI